MRPSAKRPMRRYFRRSLLWLLPVVLIPITALLVTQYNFLRSLEKTTASAERNWLRGSLDDVARSIEQCYRHSASLALTVPPAYLWDDRTIGAHFKKHSIPGARSFFYFRYGDMASVGQTFDARGVPRREDTAAAEAIKLATVSWFVASRMGRIVPQPSLYVDERDPHAHIITRPVTDESMHVIGVVGVLLDEDASKQSMIRMGADVLKKRNHDNDVYIRISETMPRMPGGHEYISQPLGFVFTNWRLGIRDLCASPEQIAADSFRLNMMWTGGVMLVLLVAVMLALQATMRQMRLSQMKSEFVSNVSHELRTPLSSIRVFGEYMRLGRVTREEKIREYGEYIEAESRRLTQLINNILDFSKIESAEKKYRFADTDVVDLVASTVAAFEMPLREKGYTIAFNATSNRPLLSMDKDAIGQVLMNLLDNAVKYSGERKEIEVAVTSSAAEVRVAVRDHGIGIPPCEQKKIFDKFYRVGSALVHDVKGSGLGLAIVTHVVKAHGGRVELASAPGEGSTFTIVLPAKAPETVPISHTTEYA